jgi:rod shape-determining protein MreB and related proteins
MAHSFIGRDMAVDLGTATTVVYVRGRGVLLDEASVVALDTETGQLRAVGHRAARMAAVDSGLTLVRPVRDGVVADFEATEQMLRFAIQRVHRRRYLTKPRLVVCVPSGTTAVERRVVREAGYQAGARRVFVIEAPLAAALGAGLPVHARTGQMVLDVGAGVTQAAVISGARIVAAACVRVAGDDLDRALAAWLKREHSLLVGDATAEELKLALGSAYPRRGERYADVCGRDLATGRPATVNVTATDVRRALDEPLTALADVVADALDRTPPALVAGVRDQGLVLTGGGALLPGLVDRLGDETGLPVHVADQPRTAAAMGAGRCVEAFDALQPLLVPDRARAA